MNFSAVWFGWTKSREKRVTSEAEDWGSSDHEACAFRPEKAAGVAVVVEAVSVAEATSKAEYNSK